MMQGIEERLAEFLFQHRRLGVSCACGWVGGGEPRAHPDHLARLLKNEFLEGCFIRARPSCGPIMSYTEIGPADAESPKAAQAQTVRAFTAMPCRACGTVIAAETERMLCILGPSDDIRLINYCMNCW